ncbi:Uma2 family endonuclease [Laspinema sp. A4]|uniref:Uma2 family endonuclease n=1 Tax=Laspinema sp. D2d TaxID=2953686 RepID=UPI0021BB9AEC|nr:Uma2 family endonuclease [Laspinema sp. D2d]MCT7983771.1 Uma2 family endonuclease [Laspinema sp. D2d]
MTLTTAKRFTIEEYHRLIELGFFAEGDRTELIQGEAIQMVPKGKPHAVCCMNLNEQLILRVSGQGKIRCQDPITLPNHSEPEPDFTLVQNREDNYLSHHPMPDDILLVIEIADSSLDYDRQVKLPLYAEAGISDYWIVNLLEKQLEIYTTPYQKSTGTFDYRQKQVKLPNETTTIPGVEGVSWELNRIFPAISP